MSELKLWRPIVHDLLEPSKNDPIQRSDNMVWRFSPEHHNYFIKAKLVDLSLDKARDYLAQTSYISLR